MNGIFSRQIGQGQDGSHEGVDVVSLTMMDVFDDDGCV